MSFFAKLGEALATPIAKKVLIALGVMVALGVFAFIIYRQEQIAARQLAIQTEMVEQKQLLDGIVRSQATWATRDDLAKMAKDNSINLKTIQDDLDKLHADVEAINIAVATSKAQQGDHQGSTGTGGHNPTPPGKLTCPDGTPCPNTDPFGYMKDEQKFALNEDFGSVKVPIGTVGFSAWQDKPWSYDIKAREYRSSTVIGTDENQRMYVYNKFSVNVDGKDYNIPIASAKTSQVYPEPKFSWFNPRLYAGMDGAIGLNPVKGEFTPSIGVQIMSYGKYKTQPDFSILQVGVGYGTVSQRPQVVVSPFQYNVGEHLPLMNNTYVGPVISVGTDANVFVGAGLRVGL